MSRLLEPLTSAGKRFVAAVEAHAGAFRERADAHDRDGSFPVQNFDDLKKSGAMAAFVPEEFGGLGLDSVHDWTVGLSRLGSADASTAIALNMHLAVSRMLALAGNEPMLRAIAAGDLVICATATEPGTDFLRPLTSATPTSGTPASGTEGGAYTISGRKLFVTLSPVANLYAMNVRVKGPGEDQIGFVFMPASTPGLELQDDWDALGMRGSGSQSLVIRDCRVPEGSVQLAGQWGRWSPGLLMGRTLGNITLVGAFLGIAERARELAVAGARAQTKPKYDGAIAQAAGVQHLLGEIDIELAGARAILSDTTRRLDEFLAGLAGESPSLEAAHDCMRDYQCAKWIVNQSAIGIVSRAMDVCGGGSYMSGHELSRLYRDVRAGPFMQPFSPTEAREYVGRVALGLHPEG